MSGRLTWAVKICASGWAGAILLAALLGALNFAALTPVSAEGDATMSLSISGSDATCTLNECTVALGESFTLTVDANSVPDSGYLLVQSFIDFGPDLTYVPTEDQADEVIWPDCAEGVAVRFQISSEAVNHGCLTGLIPPLPLSTYTGPIFEIGLNCSDTFSRTNVHLLPYGDALADTSGALFGLEQGASVNPKLSSVTVSCGEPPPDAPADIVLPTTGSAPLGDNNGGPNIVLWFVVGALAVAGAAGTGACGWREARRRQSP